MKIEREAFTAEQRAQELAERLKQKRRINMSDINVNTQRSEVARLLDQIREEYEAAMRGLSGLSQGTSRHSFITARTENMGKLQTQLDDLIGDMMP